jgi:hypothetical protein
VTKSSYLATIARRARSEGAVLLPPRVLMRGWEGSWSAAESATEESSLPIEPIAGRASATHGEAPPPVESAPSAEAGVVGPLQPAPSRDELAATANVRRMQTPTASHGAAIIPNRIAGNDASHAAKVDMVVPSPPASPAVAVPRASFARGEEMRKIDLPRPSETVRPASLLGGSGAPPAAASVNPVTGVENPGVSIAEKSTSGMRAATPRSHATQKSVDDHDGPSPLPAPHTTPAANPRQAKLPPDAPQTLSQPYGRSPAIAQSRSEQLRPVLRPSAASSVRGGQPQTTESTRSKTPPQVAQALHAALKWVSRPVVEPQRDDPARIFSPRQTPVAIQSAPSDGDRLDPADQLPRSARRMISVVDANVPTRTAPRTIHIGTIEVQIQSRPAEAASLPPPPQARLAQPVAPAPTSSLASSFTTSLGLRQG